MSSPTTATGPEGAAVPLEVPREELDQLVRGEHGQPHALLGPHRHDDGSAVTIRVLRPLASAVVVEHGGTRTALTHEHEGVWVGVLGLTEVPDYRIAITYGEDTHVVDDPYRFLPTLGEMDLHLINEGRHEQLWTVLGARVHHYDVPGSETITGTSFAVWAPNARAVRLRGDFNSWDGREHPMRSLGTSGVWELFMPGLGTGTAYKFHVLGQDGTWREKADPMAFHAEVAPRTSSRVFESTHAWADDAWMTRARLEPGGGRADVGLRDAPRLVEAAPGHLVLELRRDRRRPRALPRGPRVHPRRADARHAAPLRRVLGLPLHLLLRRRLPLRRPRRLPPPRRPLHQAGIGVILDWVPGHFRDRRVGAGALRRHPALRGPQPPARLAQGVGLHIFNFGRNEVRNFLYANALYWLEEFHVDGLRVDGVASMLYLDYARQAGEWTPNVHGGRENLEAVQFLQEMNATVYRRVPGAMTIAEESTSWPGVTGPTSDGGLGFGFKWNMGWMHDTLDYLAREPIYRAHHHGELTFSIVYAWTENFVLPLSHDEVVHGKGSLLRKMPGDRWQQLATLRAYLAFMWAHPGKQLTFMGIELGQESEWAESRELDWWLLDHPEHRGVHALVRDLNAAYKASPATWARDDSGDGFSWIDANDAGRNVFSFVRRSPDDADVPDVVCVTNFAAVPHGSYRLGFPQAGQWDEVLNTDAAAYTGSDVGNLGGVTALEGEHTGQPAYADITVPPLATVWFRRRTGSVPV